MRFYDLQLIDTSGTIPRIVKRWQSHPAGKFDPGALLIEFDIIVTAYATPAGGQQVSVYGVSREDMNQWQQFTGLQLALYGGMAAGLPLANPTQQGLLMSGIVFQSWGTWEGTEMKLDFIVLPDEFYIGNPANLVLNWLANTPLAPALYNALSIAYPQFPILMNGQTGGTLTNIVQSNDEHKPAANLSIFSLWLLERTTALGHPVNIVIQSGKIHVFDDTYKPKPTQLQFADFVGQPTWISPNVMQVKTILRADIIISSQILMPVGMQNAPGFILQQGNTLAGWKYQSSFKGAFNVIEGMRHIGNYKAHEGAAWATLLNCTPENPNG